MKNIFIILCVCLLIGNDYVYGQKLSWGAIGIGEGTSPLEKFNPNDVASSAKDALIGIAKQIPDSIPSVDNILSFGKNALAGVPFQVAFDLINKACKFSKN